MKKHAEKLRFGVVGGANTALDFGILFVLVFLGLDKFVANFLSTSIAFIFSFFVNKSFTFKSKGGNAKKQFGMFVLITLFGLWVIQPIIIVWVGWVISDLGIPDSLVLFIGKLLATVVTLIWNYVLYAKYVFQKGDR
ncbi:GtrA family protein [Candidatus Saccharibacteria bacterium]|nr:GtrA family protein [Candidatus Saccharibacteria bacterium]